MKSAQKKQHISEISEEQVKVYLEEHPEFFHRHLDLLERLSIPHPSGNAVSLISKQLEIFRNKHHELENQLTSLIDIARDNDTVSNHMHVLTLAMLDSATLEDVLANLEHVLFERFRTDFVALRIVKRNDESPVSNLFIDPHDASLIEFAQILTSNQPKCGRPTLAQAGILFGEAAPDVKSCALIPMLFTELEGVIAIGSRQENRFHAGMGHLFLTQMSEIVGTRLISLLHTG
ncbi:MAG: DUF484 family protein [Gammaproteobacteria bacterium]